MTLKDTQRQITDRLSETSRTIQTNIRELVDKAGIGKNVEKQIKSIQSNIDKAINLTLMGLHVATRDQISYLDKKIDALNRKVDKLGGGRGKMAAMSKSKKSKKKAKPVPQV